MLIDKFETGSNGFVWQNAQPDELLSRVQFHVYTAHRSKVGKDWCGDKFVNHYNRIYYVNSGSATLRFKDQTVNMQAGYLYLIPAYKLISHDCEGNLDFYWTHFQARIDFGIDFFMLYANAMNIKCQQATSIQQDFSALIEVFKESNINNIFARQRLLLSLLQPFLSSINLQTASNSNKQHHGLAPALALMNKNITGKITLKELSAAVSLSPEHFSRKFKSLFNLSPKRYITSRRISLAKQKLLLSSQPIEKVAIECGFGDIFHFSRTFKFEVGISPSEFRQGHDVSDFA